MTQRKRDESSSASSAPMDLQFRPATYWPAPASPVARLARIKGQRRRELAREVVEENERAFNSSPLFEEALEDDVRAATGRIHPSLMGGEYLPRLAKTEVEIARACLASALSDVISIRARRHADRIRYRVFDEYADQGNEYEITRHRSSRLPLTMQELIELIDSVRHAQGEGLTEAFREMQLEVLDPEEAVGFVRVESEFYPELHAYYEREAQEWLWDHQRTRFLQDLHDAYEATCDTYTHAGAAVLDPAALSPDCRLFASRMYEGGMVAGMAARRALARWARYRLGLDAFELSDKRPHPWSAVGVSAAWHTPDGEPAGGPLDNTVADLRRLLLEASTDAERGARLLQRDLAPDSSLSPLERADLTWYLGDQEAAKRMLRELATSDFGSAVDRLISAGDHQAARELCETALRAEEGQAGALAVEREEVLERLAYLALGEGDEDRALELWMEARPDDCRELRQALAERGGAGVI